MKCFSLGDHKQEESVELTAGLEEALMQRDLDGYLKAVTPADRVVMKAYGMHTFTNQDVKYKSWEVMKLGSYATAV